MAFFYSYLQDTDRPSLKSTDHWATFGVFEIGKQITWIWMRNENRNSGISNLEQTRTEMQTKKRKIFLIFSKKTSFWNKTKQGELCCGKFIFSATFFLPIKGSRNNSVCSFKSIDIPYQIIKSLIKIWILIYIWVFRVYIFRICIGSGTPNPWIDLQFCQKI